jgi:hypothetical protein
MFCEKCCEIEATVFFTQIIDGETRRQNLCKSCAQPLLDQIPPAPPPLTEEERAKLLERPVHCPTEVTLTDPITLPELASALHAEFYQILFVLMEHQIYKRPDDPLDFTTASLVCAHYGVTPHKAA